MGYSISIEQANKLERYEKEGRRCSMSTGRGGCFNRATVREVGVSWYYEEDKAAGKEPHPFEHTLCSRHAFGSGYEGRNFVVVESRRF